MNGKESLRMFIIILILLLFIKYQKMIISKINNNNSANSRKNIKEIFTKKAQIENNIPLASINYNKSIIDKNNFDNIYDYTTQDVKFKLNLISKPFVNNKNKYIDSNEFRNSKKNLKTKTLNSIKENFTISQTNHLNFYKTNNKYDTISLFESLNIKPLELNCKSQIVIDAKNNRIICQSRGVTYKTPKQRTTDVKLSAQSPIPIASCTKIITMLIVINCIDNNLLNFSDKVTIKEHMLASGSSAKLKTGQTHSIKDLLHALILPSGNDAACTFAYHIGEILYKARHPSIIETTKLSIEMCYLSFIREMNNIISILGLKHSKFYEPHGYNLAEKKPRSINVMSAIDLSLITAFAMSDKRIVEICSTINYSSEVTPECKWTNNTLGYGQGDPKLILNIPGMKGCKNGGTDVARFCQSTYVEIETVNSQDVKAIVCITLGSDSRDYRATDTRSLVKQVIENL